MIGSNDHFCFRPTLFDNPSCFNSIQLRHRDIHQNDIRKKILHFPDSIVAVRRFADNNDMRQLVKKIMDNLPIIPMVICNKNFNSVHTIIPSENENGPLLTGIIYHCSNRTESFDYRILKNTGITVGIYGNYRR